ncbi:unnamed protein product, partial [Staurois parvus]
MQGPGRPDIVNAGSGGRPDIVNAGSGETGYSDAGSGKTGGSNRAAACESLIVTV